MDEVVSLADAFVRAFPGQVRRLDAGLSPEGRPIVALVASQDGVLDAGTARARSRPVVLVQGGIHAGEIDGKDAGFLALRELLRGEAAPGALTRTTLVFVPVLNVDGHERFGAWNRPNQDGPEAMGWRTTAANLNLNRDYMKADAPETRAALALLRDFDPVCYADLHVTDGADFQPGIALVVEPALAGPEPLRTAARTLRDGLLAHLAAEGHTPLGFYPSFATEDDPRSGFTAGAMAPRFSNGYAAARDRIGVLVETHSWKPYAERVRATRDAIVGLVSLVAERGPALLAAAREVDAQGVRNDPAPVALDVRTLDAAREIDFPGYAVVREPSPVSGRVRVRYDRSKPEVFRVPLRDQVVPTLEVTPPRCGYVVEAGFAAPVAERLRAHGIVYAVVTTASAEMDAEVFRAERPRYAAEPYEGRTRAAFEGAWTRERRTIATGSLLVPAAQARRRLAMHLLEPRAPDSLASWGFFHARLQRQEYMEAYVTEAVAEAMLARDPALRAAFIERLARDEAFARDAGARLEFFYRRHPSWDERWGLLPVWRIDVAP